MVVWFTSGGSVGGAHGTATGDISGWPTSPPKDQPSPPPASAPKVTARSVARQPAGLSLPPSNESGPIPYIIGTVRVDGNVTWYGNQDTIVTYTNTIVAPGVTSSTPNYRDVVDVQFGLCTGPGVHLIGIYGENNFAIWTGNVGPDETTFSPAIADGIFSGQCTFYGGEFDQPVNATLAASIVGEDVPAFVGTSYLMVVAGDRNNNFALSFELRRTPNPLGLAPEINVSADGADVNLATMIVDFMTTKWNGGGNDIGIFDLASFISSGTILASEGNFGSAAVSDEGVTPDDLIKQIEAQADGTIFVHPSTGLLTFRLFREDSVDLNDPTLPVFSNANIEGHPNFQKNGWDNAVNQVRVMYSDRTEGYAQLPAIAQTIEVASSGGRTRQTKLIEFPLACTKELGSKLAARVLALNSAPRFTQSITTTRKGAYLLPGDVILLNWDNYKQARTPYFVTKRRDLPKADNKVALDLAQFSTPPSNALFPPPEDSGYQYEIHDPLPPKSVRIIDAPYIFGCRRKQGDFPGAAQLYTPYDQISMPMCLAEAWGHFQAVAYMKYDPDYDISDAYLIGGGVTPATNNVPNSLPFSNALPYAACGVLNASIGEYVGITDAIVPSMVIHDIFRTISTPSLIGADGQFIFVNDEILYADFKNGSTISLVGTTLTLTNLRRSAIDTVKQAHSAGDDVRIMNLYYQGASSGYTYIPSIALPDDGSVSPFPEFLFTGKAYFNGKFSAESPTSLRHASYEAYEPAPRYACPYRPHGTVIAANPRSATPVGVTRSATATISWEIRSRWMTGYIKSSITTRIWDPTTEWHGPVASAFYFGQGSMFSEYDGGKYARHRVMIKDSANVVWDLGSTADNDYDLNSLLVTWPAGAAVGDGLLWVEQYNTIADSSRFKDTLPITIV